MNSPVSPASLAGIKLNLPKQRGAYYDGKWHEPKNGRYVETPNPATSESLGKVADAGADDHDIETLAHRSTLRIGATEIVGRELAGGGVALDRLRRAL